MRWWVLGFLLAGILAPATPSSPESGGGDGGGEFGGRSLLGYVQTKGNASFQCSPSGRCLPCQYSEKNDEKYRCSETGYRVPLKCVEIQESSKGETIKKKQRTLYSHHEHEATAQVHQRLLADDPSTLEAGKQRYITYRSCVPADGEEKLSVLGFEMIMVGMLLISGSVVYLKQKHGGVVMPGVVAASARLPPRF